MSALQKTIITVLAMLATLGVAAAIDNWFHRERSTALPTLFGVGPTLERYHDDEKGVTCWVLRHSDGPAISCIPDRELPPTKLER